MRMRSVMQHAFSQVPRAEIPRSSFDRSHGYKTTFNVDRLYPIFVDEALPGDTFNLNLTAFARLATPIFPIMDNMYLETFFFAVPYRLVWENWERFNGAQDDPDDSTDFLIPVQQVPVGGFVSGSLADYFGLPVGVGVEAPSALPFRAYWLIFNEWFRDQNLQDSTVVPKDDGPDGTAYVGNPVRRGKRHDYFTSCLPFPQKGDSVQLPLGSSAPVYGTGAAGTAVPSFVESGIPLAPMTLLTTAGSSPQALRTDSVNPTTGVELAWEDPALEADLSAATAATINQLRQAFAVQKLLERDARGGTRYTEIVRAHFGVVSPDARLQRPEYLGGGSSRINITPVAQTSSTTAAVESGETPTPQGNLAAFGTVAVNRHGFTKSFTEHCIIIGLVNVRADLTYQQGINRMWTRQTRYDFYWPALAHIGEQAVLSKEIYADGSADDQLVFGYQERYAEYRYKPSMITGKMRSNVAGSLDAWHLSQDFETRPELDVNFIVSNTPLERAIAVTDEPHFIMDAYFNLRCARPMPLYGVPGFIDRF